MERLDQAVSLVNALTGSAARGRVHVPPAAEELPEAIPAAMSVVPAGGLDAEQAAYLLRTAEQLRLAFEELSAGRPDEAAEVVNALLHTTGARPHLHRRRDGPLRLHFHAADDSPAVSTSASCATGVALALGGDMADRLGVCQAARCDRVYVDTSRNAARQFCSTTCQNRMKTAAFRARQQGN